MKRRRILIGAHDPGAANVVVPVAEALAGRDDVELFLFAAGPALPRLQAVAPHAERIVFENRPIERFPLESDCRPEEVDSLLKSLQPDAVFTGTSYNSNLDWALWKAARRLGIRSACIVDFWSAYRSRFERQDELVAPEFVFACDQRMRSGLLDAVGEFTHVIVSGNPHLRQLRKRIAADALPDAAPTRIRFMSENMHHYFPDRRPSEFDIVNALAKILTNSSHPPELIVRPHPMEDRAAWTPALEALRKAAPALNARLDTVAFEDALRDRQSAVVGISSMALLETAVCGLPTFSWQIDLPQAGFLFLPFEEYGIEPVLTEHDALKLAALRMDVGRTNDVAHGPEPTEEILKVLLVA